VKIKKKKRKKKEEKKKRKKSISLYISKGDKIFVKKNKNVSKIKFNSIYIYTSIIIYFINYNNFLIIKENNRQDEN